MSYKYRNPQNRMRAAALLRHLKNQLIDVTGIEVEALSNTAATAEAYWQLSKACGVHVYQEGDGWHADLEFQGLPNGVADLIGTPTPTATRAEAIESVVSMMSICKQRDAVPPPDPRTGMRWFKFDQHEVPIHLGLLADYEAQARTLNTDPADITSDLDDVRFAIAGDGPLTTQAWQAASFQDRYDAIRICHIAMANGVRQTTFASRVVEDASEAACAPGMH